MKLCELAAGLQHIGIPTLDIKQTVAFYEGLGFTVDWKADSRGLAFLRMGNLVIEAYEGEGAAGVSGAIDHLAIDVTDIEPVYQAALDGGYAVMQETIQFLPFFEKGVRFFTILGPNREKIEFNQKL